MPRNEPYPEEMIPIADIPEALLVGAGMHPDYPRDGQPEGRISWMDLKNFGTGEYGGTFRTRAEVARQNDNEPAYVKVARGHMNLTGNDFVDMPTDDVNWSIIGDAALDGDPWALNILRRANQHPLVTYYEDLEYINEKASIERLRPLQTHPIQDLPQIVEDPNAPSVPQNKSARLIMAYLSNEIPVPQKVQNEYPDLYRKLLDVPPRDMKRMLRMKPDTDGKMEKMFKSKLDHGIGITENEKLTYPTAYESAYFSHHGHQPQDFLDMDTSGDSFINSVLDQVNEKYTTPVLKDDTFKTLSDDEKLIRAYAKNNMPVPESLLKDDTFKTLSDDEKLIRAYAKNDMPVPESLLEDNNEYYQRTLQELQDSGEIRTDEMRKEEADLRKERQDKNKKRQQELIAETYEKKQKQREEVNERRKNRGLPPLPPIKPPKGLIPPTPPTPSQPTPSQPTPTSIGGPNRPSYNLPSTNIGSRIIPPQFSEFKEGRFSDLGVKEKRDDSTWSTGYPKATYWENGKSKFTHNEDGTEIDHDLTLDESRDTAEDLLEFQQRWGGNINSDQNQPYQQPVKAPNPVPDPVVDPDSQPTTVSPDVLSMNSEPILRELQPVSINPQGNNTQSRAAQQLGENATLRLADNDSQSQQQQPIIVNAPVTNNNQGGGNKGGVNFASTTIQNMNDGFMTLPRWRRQYG